MKTIIERKLNLTDCYNLITTKYIALIDGIGCGCDNCGRPIANIATIKAESCGKVYNIGFDCLDTILLNNQILRGEDLDNYNACKKSLPKIKKIVAYFKEFHAKNPFLVKTTITIEKGLNPLTKTNWLTYEFFDSNNKKRWNDGHKVKDMHYPTLLATLQQIKGVTFVLQ